MKLGSVGAGAWDPVTVNSQHAGWVAGRAFVVPSSTGNVHGNENNFRADSRVRSSTVLVARSAADGGPLDPASKRIEVDLPNWLRVVMYYAGNNDGPWRQLPAELVVPVAIDARTRQIVAMDVDTAAEELAAYREVGRREWLETEAPLSDVRAVIGLPGAALRGLRGLVGEARSVVSDIRNIGGSSPQKPMSAEELETRRRTATMLRYQLERNPKQYATIRKSVVEAGPMMARNLASGSITRQDFDVWMMHNELSGVITAAEVAQWLREAGIE
jgi:hypothetical protein